MRKAGKAQGESAALPSNFDRGFTVVRPDFVTVLLRPIFALPCGRGGIGRHARFRIWCRKVWGFEPLRPHISFEYDTTTWRSPRKPLTP
jgi:hypothetical protein